MSDRGDIPALKELLRARIDDLVRRLAPGPESCRNGRYWIPPNPTRTDNSAGSFFIWIKGNAIGAWKDTATGDKGDIIQLIQYCEKLDIRAAIQWAKDWLDYKDMPPAKRAQVTADAAAKRAREQENDAAEIEKGRRRAFMHWTKCEPELRNTLAERYYETRGIILRDLVRMPRALRYAPAEKHVESGEHFPCIVALITDSNGRALAIHRTWLARDGYSKAPVTPARKIWPRGWAGGTIKIARGETKLSPKAAHEQGLWDRLMLCEGIEDGLSLALACPEFRIWAAGTLGNLAAVKIPACSGEAIVVKDNDWGKRQAKAQLQGAIEALAAQGPKVLVASSHVGKDANDALRGAA